MRAERLTTPFQMALADAQSLAVGADNPTIEPLHLLAAMAAQEEGGIPHILMRAGVEPNKLQRHLKEAIAQLPKVQGGTATGEVHPSNDTVRLLNIADKLAQQRGDQYIASEMAWLAAFELPGRHQDVLRSAGLSKEALQRAVDEVRGGEAVTSPEAEAARGALSKYTIDLTARAEQGKLDPVIGRDEEIRRVVQVLQRRTKNNPMPFAVAAAVCECTQ